jgi:RNA polymerase sigma-70 factor (ECF subfamily)
LLSADDEVAKLLSATIRRLRGDDEMALKRRIEEKVRDAIEKLIRDTTNPQTIERYITEVAVPEVRRAFLAERHRAAYPVLGPYIVGVAHGIADHLTDAERDDLILMTLDELADEVGLPDPADQAGYLAALVRVARRRARALRREREEVGDNLVAMISRLHRHAALRLEPALADDVAQATIADVYQALRRGTFIENLDAYAWSVLVRAHNRLVRERRRYVALDRDLPGPDQHAEIDLRAAARQLAWRARLSPRERQVLLLALAGYRNTDIAEELGISPGAVGRYLSNARQKIGDLR